MQSYNGWSGAIRTSRGTEHNVAMKLGTAPPPGACEICGQTRGTMWHAEQYGPTFEDYLKACHSLCGHCHAMLHVRFSFPNRWKLHLLNHGQEKGLPLNPAPFITSMGAIFARARTWVDVRGACVVSYGRGPEWFHHLPGTQ